ncbi:MAG: glycosyltransferase [Clostridia bacterium]|nr:glycosyltransferase [Clostridia bacterium]
MSGLQVLVATMRQTDLSIAERMNIRCEAVIANQTDRNELTECIGEYGRIRMVSTNTVGVGLNRNIALFASDSDIILFADDDVVYNDDMPQNVLKAFSDNPKADVIIFSMDITRGGEVTEKRHLKRGRRRLWNSLRFGTYVIAARRSSVMRNNITFNQFFGGGCIYGAGEDSLFIKACFDAGLRVYSHEYVLGRCAKDVSSWFSGHNEKFFYDKGALMGYLFPRTAALMTLYFSLRFKRSTDIPPMKRVRLMNKGRRGGKNLVPFGQGK